MAAASSTSLLLLKVAHLPHRGRALLAAHTLLPGQILLQESPLLYYLEAQAAASKSFCSHCLRCLSQSASASPCLTCQDVLFCTPACALAASASSHTPFVCRAFCGLIGCIRDADLQTQARYLIAAYNLGVVSPAAFQQLLLLEGEGVVDDNTAVLHSFMRETVQSVRLSMQTLPTWSVELVAALLAKDQRNAFGLMAPTVLPGQRKVRAYAIYTQASFLNHDCLPNAGRVDYVDRMGGRNTDIIIRALHEVPEGREVCISYFPINWPFADRQKKLKEEYGFDCKCERCKVEESWSDREQAEDISVEGEEGDEEMGSPQKDEMEEADQDSFPHAMFFFKYLCPRDDCGGTMVPLPPDLDGASASMECNVCGHLRTEESFLEDLENHSVL